MKSAGLHGGIGYMEECRIIWWECWVTCWGVLSYMVQCLVICCGCWIKCSLMGVLCYSMGSVGLHSRKC